MTSFAHELKNHPIRTLKTGIMCFIFIGLGINIASVGPALLDLQDLAETGIEKAALLLPCRSFGYAIGSVVGGILSEKIDHQKIIMISMVFATIAMFFFAIFPSIIVMCIIISIGGLANGSMDTVVNVWVIHIWGKSNPPFMQIVHFAYGLGALFAPLIVAPFLATRNEKGKIISDAQTWINETTVDNSTVETTVYHQIRSANMIQWPFIIGSIYYLVGLLAFVIIYFRYPDNSIHPSRDQGTDQEIDPTEKKDKFKLNKPLSYRLHLFVVAVSIFSMHAYTGLEISFDSLLAPFAVKSNLKMTTSEGSYITSIYWSAFTFFRIFSLIAIIYLSPRFLLLVNFAIIMMSNVFLVPFANTYRWALWTGSTMMGLGCSSVFATVFAFLEQLTPVTGKITAGFLVAACFGEFVIPAVTSAFIENYPQIFLWIVLIYSSASFIGILILMVVQFILLKKQKTKEKLELRSKLAFNNNNIYAISYNGKT